LLEYDENYNLTKMALPTGAVTEWTYNDFGECTEVINPLGKKQHFEYDRLGRLQHIKFRTAEVIDLKYDLR
jgi:YD repeat-containing protein